MSKGSSRPFRNLRTILALGLLIAIGRPAAGAQAGGTSSYAQPGRLVRLNDGRSINLNCTGKGLPTVVLESGFGAGASAWAGVQPLIAAKTRVCSYDRAGYGFSDPGRMPRDGEAIARDLDQTLRRAGERGPFVAVGHSAGGLYARLFAARRVRETIALVLVEPSVPFQDRRVAAIVGPNAGSLEGVRHRPAACLEAAIKGSQDALDALGCLPKESADMRVIASRPSTWRTQLSELDTLFKGTSAQVLRTIPVLKDKPVIILTASPTGLPAGKDNPSAMVWQGLHHETAGEFLKGQQRLVKSSHLMMNDRPEVVAATVLESVEAGRLTSQRR